jgi:hypothetical protein
MLCSRYRQRIGDHLARTLVISTGPLAYRSPQFAGQPGMRAEDVGTGAGQPSAGQPGMGQPGAGQTSMSPPSMGQPGVGQPGMGQTSMGQGKPGDIR